MVWIIVLINIMVFIISKIGYLRTIAFKRINPPLKQLLVIRNAKTCFAQILSAILVLLWSVQEENFIWRLLPWTCSISKGSNVITFSVSRIFIHIYLIFLFWKIKSKLVIDSFTYISVISILDLVSQMPTSGRVSKVLSKKFHRLFYL